jgi:ubiquinone/menaquinone biosynthesis C-methylase UbiE
LQVAFEALKERQSFVWGNGPFEHVADTIADIHRVVVDVLRPAGGRRWLEVACGTGDLAELAAAAGAEVVGVDFAPPMIETARRRAAEHGFDIDYRVGDAENLEGIDDASFDVVSSTFGVMFAPDHQRAAGELARVTRNGGRLGLATWTPDGSIGELFRMLAPFQPPPPEGAGLPLDWGRPEHVRELLGDAFELMIEERTSVLEVESAQAYWDKFAPAFGPVKTLLESLDAEGREEVRRTWIDFFESNYRSNGSIKQPRQYLLVVGTRK